MRKLLLFLAIVLAWKIFKNTRITVDQRIVPLVAAYYMIPIKTPRIISPGRQYEEILPAIQKSMDYDYRVTQAWYHLKFKPPKKLQPPRKTGRLFIRQKSPSRAMMGSYDKSI